MRLAQARRLGMSLLELILALTLIVLLFVLMFNFLIPTLRAATRGETMVEMEQEGTVALQKICDDLAQSGEGGVSLNGSYCAPPHGIYPYVTANACCTQPLTPPTPPVTFSIEKLSSVCTAKNSQLWNYNRITLYTWDSSGDLVRRFFPAGTCGTKCIPGALACCCPPDLPGQIPALTLDTLALNAGLKKEILATGVTWFSVTYPTALSKCLTPPTIKTQCGYPASPLTITITLVRYSATGSTKPLTATFGRTMSMREQGTAKICGPTGTPAPCP